MAVQSLKVLIPCRILRVFLDLEQNVNITYLSMCFMIYFFPL